MPRKTDIDFELAKQLYLTGLPIRKIAEKLQCSRGTLKSRCHRERWATLGAKATEMMQSEPVDWQSRAESWVNRTVKACEAKMRHLESLDPSRLSAKDLKMLVEVQRILDDMARRSFQLDRETNEKPVGLVRVVVVNQSANPPELGYTAICDSIETV